MVALKQLAQSAAKGRRAWLGATVMVLACLSASAQAQDLLVRNATVHTASARGSLQGTDVLVQGGIIARSAAACPPRPAQPWSTPMGAR